MWDLLIALLGGTFLACKTGADKMVARSSLLEYEKQRKIQENWVARVTDKELQYKMTLWHGYPRALEYAAEALALIHTFPGLETVKFNYENHDRTYNAWSMVRLIRMVKVGKLPDLCCEELGNLIELSIDQRPRRKARIAFCKWVEKTLQENGVEDARLYYTGESYASFVWEPFVKDLSTAIRVTDPDLESKMIGFDG